MKNKYTIEIEEKERSLAISKLDELVKQADGKYLDKLSGKSSDAVFCEINCLDCGNCCKSAPPLLSSSDVKRISNFLQISKKQFMHRYSLTDPDGTVFMNRIPCPFLGKGNVCEIYEARPMACKDYPHFTQPRFKQLHSLHRKNLDICPAAVHIVNLIYERTKGMDVVID